jgi:hypothetical protein
VLQENDLIALEGWVVELLVIARNFRLSRGIGRRDRGVAIFAIIDDGLGSMIIGPLAIAFAAVVVITSVGVVGAIVGRIVVVIGIVAPIVGVVAGVVIGIVAAVIRTVIVSGVAVSVIAISVIGIVGAIVSISPGVGSSIEAAVAGASIVGAPVTAITAAPIVGAPVTAIAAASVAWGRIGHPHKGQADQRHGGQACQEPIHR